MFILQMLCIAIYIMGPIFVALKIVDELTDNINLNVFLNFIICVLWVPLSLMSIWKTIMDGGFDYDDIFEFIDALLSNLIFMVNL